jgi:hypothetical protein
MGFSTSLVGSGQQLTHPLSVPARLGSVSLDHQGAMMDSARMNRSRLLLVMTLALTWSAGHAADARPQTRPPAPSLKPATTGAIPVDDRGFVRRWLVLEPIGVNGLTMDAVEKMLQDKPYPTAATTLPKDGELAPWAGPELRWHAVDTLGYNVNLYHFAWALSRPTSNVLFWAVTVVDAPEEMKNVRLAICSNAASAWWLNEERLISLYNDRQAVIDDGVSKRVTLRKGPNVIRAAIVNGGGATDFCARFLDAQDQPVKGLKNRVVMAPAQ